MNSLFSLLFLASTTILPHDSFIIEADKAVSANENLQLSGHVKIQSGPLTAESEEASCSQDKQSPLFLNVDVRLFIENYGQINCASAFLDPSQHIAQFNSLGSPVIYKDVKLDLYVEASQMSLFLSDNNQKLKSFTAHKDVKALWKYGLSCEGEEAFFHPENHTLTFLRAHIIAKDKLDMICQRALLDTKTHSVSLEHVAGFLQASENLHVIADHLHYLAPLITLTGNVSLNMQLTAGEATLSAIHTCVVNEALHTIQLHPLPSSHIFLKTPYGTVKADNIDLLYEETDGEYKLQNLVLKGAVELANTFSFKDPETPVNRYAIAHIVEVDCFDKIMTLKPLKNQRVLFLDEGKKVQVSADAIAVCYKDGQEEISGKGAVRMLFTDSELLRFSERFHK
ncbi:MAG: hypothetical protein WCN87_01125 [Chlamydiota bacterium]